ncbi:MAG: acetoacetyl-CoA reductase [Alphaproteobacteria bacterium]|nr:acetoacetyl-CoA reductase [Alphaproteobacteria bacterium]TAD88698.1 MAG: acetoacetyl-CoA reductase [Alphaproteobacteria bacterium]
MARVAVVTGGTRGIGAAISTALKAAGYTVAASYAGNDAAAQKFKDETGIHVEKWDVGSVAACREGIARVEAALGPVEVLVNNAGITRDGFFHKMTEEQWDEVIATNLKSCYGMCRAVIEGMRTRGFGRIVNLSSVNGQKGQLGQVNYAAAKAGMIGFTKALALEGASKGITVNCIAPGYVLTEMTGAIAQPVLDKIIAQIPIGRMGLPAEIARTVLYLVADEAAFITGATISINGGQYMVG